MTARSVDTDFLRNKHVAFTGKLASMTRQEAANLVRKHGGQFDATVNRRTAYLVIGQEGWPLQKDGRPTAKLLKARRLQRQGHTVHCLQEAELLNHLGLSSRSHEICRHYTAGELCQTLQVPRERLRAWTRAGLIVPVDDQHGIAYFDFRQVSGARTLCSLVEAGVTIEQVRKSLLQISAWAATVDHPLAQLAILEKDGDVLVRVGENLAEPSGQLRFDFEAQPDEPVVELPSDKPTADELFESGCDVEAEGKYKEAEACYRRSLLVGGPDAVCSFNLANVLYAQGRRAEAAERFYQVVEIDNQDAGAWNNLGAVLAELKRSQEAIVAYEKAIELAFYDAHFNLAELFDGLGRKASAREHWQAYLRHDSTGVWASKARQRLNAVS